MRKTIRGRTWHFEEKWVFGDKNWYKLFCNKRGFEYFSYNNLKTKKQKQNKKTIFSKITAKIIFGRHDHFLKNGVSDDKNEYRFFYGKWIPNTALNFFLHKTPYWLNESQKTNFGGTFSPYQRFQWFYWTNCFQKTNWIHPCVDSHQPCEFHKNRFKTTTCVVIVIIIKVENLSVTLM